MNRHPAFCFVAAMVCLIATATSPSAQDTEGWTVMGVVVGVDSKPAADASIVPQRQYHLFDNDRWPAKTNAKGIFRVQMPTQARYCPTLIATSADGEHLGWQPIFMYEENELLEITLEPVRKTTVKVVDSNQAPVPGARIAAIQGSVGTFPEVTTGDDGTATLRLPDSMGIAFVYAIDDTKGFNYHENFSAWPSPKTDPLPRELTIKLLPPEPVRIKYQGSGGNGIPGIETGPWTITLPGKLTRINGLIQTYQPTGDDGVATFTWIPKMLERSISFLSSSDSYHVPQNPIVSSESRSATTMAYKLATVRGMIRHADGSPAAGIMLQGEGKGDTNMYYRASVMTDEQGRYELRPFPDQTLAISVVDDAWAAKGKTGLKLTEGEVVEDVDFGLIRGTTVTGVVTVGRDRKPMTEGNATLIQDPNAGSLVRWSVVNAAGRYKFRVGPGTYSLRLPGDAGSFNLEITDQETITQDGHIDRLPRGMLVGRVLDAKKQPATGVTIHGESINAPGHAGFKVISDDEGLFETERWNDAMLLVARDTNGNASGVTRIGPDDREVVLKLRPATILRAVLVDGDGKPPSVRQGNLSVNLPHEGDSTSINLRIQIDESGRIEVPGLPGGVTGSINLTDRGDMTSGSVMINLGEEAITDAGELEVEMTKFPGR